MYYTGQEGYGRYTPADRRKFSIFKRIRQLAEETKSWLRKLIKRKVIDKSDVSKYEVVIEKLGPKLNAFINSTKK